MTDNSTANWWDLLNEAYAQRALLASLMVGLACGLLGCLIVLQNMSLIGDALSHSILPGVVVGYVVAGHSLVAIFTGSVVAGMVSAVLITLLQRHAHARSDASIGIVFSFMFSVGVIGISWLTRQEGVHLDMKDFLFGNVLGVSTDDLWLSALILVFVAGCLVLFYRFFFLAAFHSTLARTMGIRVGLLHYFLMLLLSFTVVAALQSVGVILVVAMLVIPASTALLLSRRLPHMLAWSAFFGSLSTGGGLLVALLLNWPPGPAMTVLAFVLYLTVILLARRRGYLPQLLRSLARHRRVQQEDVLKATARLMEEGRFGPEALAEKTGLTTGRIQHSLRALVRRGYLQQTEGSYALTPHGLQHAYALIRAHRLWETYMVEVMGMAPDQIHEEAERREHNLDEGLLQALNDRLGNPLQDPHGSWIPQYGTRVQPIPMADLVAGRHALVLSRQPLPEIALRLWELGLTPNTDFRLLEKTEQELIVTINGQQHSIPVALARQVQVLPL